MRWSCQSFTHARSNWMHCSAAARPLVKSRCKGSHAIQAEETTTAEGWAKLDRADRGHPDTMMDDGELPVDASGQYVSGNPIDPKDPRTAHMKPAGKSSPPERPAVSMAVFQIFHANVQCLVSKPLSGPAQGNLDSNCSLSTISYCHRLHQAVRQSMEMQKQMVWTVTMTMTC